MTLGTKLCKLRKEHQYTQEQLASLLNVSRQSISKWESDVSYPETDKLIKLSEIFGCSLDYLLKNHVEDELPSKKSMSFFDQIFKERKSNKIILGMPLWHINKQAKGIIAIGFRAQGIISIGLLSSGVLSIGLFTIGLFTIGAISLGILSIGTISLGLFAIGSIALGIISFGAISIGYFSFGALAFGKYLGVGDYVYALIAVGKSKVSGSIFEKLGNLNTEDILRICNLLDAQVSIYLAWAKDIVKYLLMFI